jgi:hypothetical protein
MADKITADRLSIILLMLGIYYFLTGIALNIPVGQELVAKLYFLPTPITEPNFMGHFGVFYIVLGILCFQARMARVWAVARPMVLTLVLACFIDAALTIVHMLTYGTFPRITYLIAAGVTSLIGVILLSQYVSNNK